MLFIFNMEKQQRVQNILTSYQFKLFCNLKLNCDYSMFFICSYIDGGENAIKLNNLSVLFSGFILMSLKLTISVHARSVP